MPCSPDDPPHPDFHLLHRGLYAMDAPVSFLRHASGCRVICVQGPPDQYSFQIGFRTPPADDCGLPHILEHCVLRGSRKYPVRDLFNELKQFSPATLLNAWTLPSQTLYFFETFLEQDFYQLRRILLDTVFFPRLQDEAVAEEAGHWRKQTDGTWRWEGIVYHEMRSACGRAGFLEGFAIGKALARGAYADWMAAGRPGGIVGVSSGDLSAFHQRHYGLANGCILLVTPQPLSAQLAVLAEDLSDGALPVGRPVPGMPSRNPPPARQQLLDIPGGPDDGSLTLVWKLKGRCQIPEVMALHLILQAAMAGQGSDFLHELRDAGWCRDVVSTPGWKEPERWISLRFEGVQDGAVEALMARILRWLREFVWDEEQRRVYQRELYQAHLHTGFPNTDDLAETCRDSLLHPFLEGVDPVEILSQDVDQYRSLLHAFEEDPTGPGRLLADKLAAYAPDLILHGRPDPDFHLRQAEAERSVFAAGTAFFAASPEAEAAAMSRAAALDAWRAAPESPDALRSLPVYTLAEIPPAPNAESAQPLDIPGLRARCLTLPIKKILSLHLTFDLSPLPEDLLPYFQLYQEALFLLGPRGASRADFENELLTCCSGLTGDTHYPIHTATAQPMHVWTVETTFPAQDADKLFTRLADLFLQPSWAPEERLVEFVRREIAETLAFYREGAPSGVYDLSSLASAGGRRFALCESFAKEEWLPLLRRESAGELAQKCQQIHRILCHGPSPWLLIAGGAEALERCREPVSRFAAIFPSDSPASGPPLPPEEPPFRMAVHVPVPMYAQAVVLKAGDLDLRRKAAAELLGDHLLPPLLHQTIRRELGAYTAGAFWSTALRQLMMYSAKDACPDRSYAGFLQALLRIAGEAILPGDLDRHKIKAIGQHRQPVSLSRRAFRAHWGEIVGHNPYTPAEEQDALAACTGAEIRETAARFAEAFPDHTCHLLAGDRNAAPRFPHVLHWKDPIHLLSGAKTP